jgi:hypothetical protein
MSIKYCKQGDTDMTKKQVAENAIITLRVAKSVIKQSGIRSPFTILEIDEQIKELETTFKLTRNLEKGNYT